MYRRRHSRRGVLAHALSARVGRLEAAWGEHAGDGIEAGSRQLALEHELLEARQGEVGGQLAGSGGVEDGGGCTEELMPLLHAEREEERPLAL